MGIRRGHSGKSVRLLFLEAPKSLQIAVMNLKDACSLEGVKQRHYFSNKGPSSQGYGFSSSHVWM